MVARTGEKEDSSGQGSRPSLDGTVCEQGQDCSSTSLSIQDQEGKSQLRHEQSGRHKDNSHQNHSQHQHHHHRNQKQSKSIDTSTDNSEHLLTATDYKNAGNRLCSLFRYEEAINYYNKAISKNPEVAIFFSNRALCYLRLQQWFLAIQDCRRALELDPNIIKAHFFLGQALSETANYDDALKHLQRAHELAKERKMNFGDDIAYQIRLIKRRRWNKIEEETEQLEDELQTYLVDLIAKDKQTRLKELKERLQAIRGESSSSQAADCPSAGASNEEAELEVQKTEIQSKCDNYVEKLETIFNNLKLQRKKRDVPDYLCGKISFEIMHDPVITPSGITYDRQDIEEHLKRVGHFDPITRQPLTANQLISNLSMKEVVDAYLDQNEWAHYY